MLTKRREFNTKLAQANLVGVNRLIVLGFIGLIILICLIRFLQFPSFWLDEAWIALQLREPSRQAIFGRLDPGLYFPRLYLSLLAILREALGYKIWTLRLLPSLCFIIGTIIWLRLLMKRSGSLPLLHILGGMLVLGSTFWLEQSIQLKQYTFDVLLALIPFVASDEVFEASLANGKDKIKLIGLALPCALSYTYPLALIARVIGWYVVYRQRKSYRLHGLAVSTFTISVLIALISIWFTDHRYNLLDRTSYQEYWNNCILHVSDNPLTLLRVVGDFIWGWFHGRLFPLVVAVVIPLQALGVYTVIKRYRNSHSLDSDLNWGSRTIGSLCLLGLVILASFIMGYPLCTGRLVLFTQVHTQILILEGALYCFTISDWRKVAKLFLYACVAVVGVYATHRYVLFMQEPPPENLRPILSLIDPSKSDTVWVHPCSIGQLKSLPDPLPIPNVITNTKNRVPESDQKVWILLSHLSDGQCKDKLNEIHPKAKNWKVVHESAGRGLVLAEF